MAVEKSGGGGGFRIMNVLGHPFFLLTLFFAVIGWIIAFISQIVAAGGGHGLDRYAWFVIFFELIFIFGIIFVVAADGFAGYRLLFTALTAIGVVGCTYVCSQTIYGNPYGQGLNGGVGSLKAVGAGYIFLSFANILWLFYFCCEEDTMIYGALNSLSLPRGGGGGGFGSSGRAPRRQDSTSDSGRGAGNYGGSSSRYGGGGVGNDPSRGLYGSGLNSYSNNGGGAGSGRAMSGQRSSTHGHGLSGAMVGSGLSAGAGNAGPSDRPSSRAASSTGLPGSKSNRPGSSSRRSLDVTSPVASGSNRPGSSQGTPTYRARALYGYEANTEDPNEISFAKGETLDIMDNSGKWWSARNQAGHVGIVPSNYLQII